MRTFDEIQADAADRIPFSNSFEGDTWTERWCDRCIHDRTARAGTGTGCPIIAVATLGSTPAEFGPRHPGRLATQYECTEFVEDRNDGREPDPEPTPLPECDGQTDVFEALVDLAVADIQAASRVMAAAR